MNINFKTYNQYFNYDYSRSIKDLGLNCETEKREHHMVLSFILIFLLNLLK